MHIDPHVHLRDWGNKAESIDHGLMVAESQGIGAVFDMPNVNHPETKQPIISTKEVADRLTLAFRANSPVFYGLYVGLTADRAQIQEAVEIYNHFPNVIGLKLFACESVGDLKVDKEDEQDLVYRTLSEERFDGVLAVHCEKESLMKPEFWNPKRPKSHSEARPSFTESFSVNDQIQKATNNNFPGHLHIAHISVPYSVELVKEAKKDNKIRISCGATPQHILLDTEAYKLRRSIKYKVNPPLRGPKQAEKMLDYLLHGDVDYLESDHAPHTLKDKIKKHMSGLPNLPYFQLILSLLRERGFTDERIDEITNTKIQEIFGLNLPEKKLNIGGDYSKDYCFNPYTHLIKK